MLSSWILWDTHGFPSAQDLYKLASSLSLEQDSFCYRWSGSRAVHFLPDRTSQSFLMKGWTPKCAALRAGENTSSSSSLHRSTQKYLTNSRFTHITVMYAYDDGPAFENIYLSKRTWHRHGNQDFMRIYFILTFHKLSVSPHFPWVQTLSWGSPRDLCCCVLADRNLQLQMWTHLPPTQQQQHTCVMTSTWITSLLVL